jgi:FkbM family methyltransferase
MTIGLCLEKVRSLISSSLGISSPSYPSPLDTEKAEQTFYIGYLQPGMVVFDVGANVGELSLLFSRFVGPAGTVHSFEASPETFDRLKTIVKLSNHPNIKLNSVAVSDNVGVSTLRVYDHDHAGWTTLADRPLHEYGIDLKPVRLENVTTTTIDVYCDSNNIEQIDLLKIDVEGAEYQVLLGASRMLEQKRIKCCVFEFGATTFDMGNTPGMIERYLADMGYRIRNIISERPCFPGRESAITAKFAIHIAEPN